MQNIETVAQSVKSKGDFIRFMAALIEDLKNDPDTWENRSLEGYLEAMQSWIEDMDGYYANNKQSVPDNISWKVFADMFIAAKMYE